MNFEYYFDKILDFYNVSTIKELSLAIDTGASTISNWKQRNSLTALKKRCRELGIYNEIFGDLNSNINNFKNSNNKVSGNGALIDNSNNKSNTFNSDKKEENTNIPQSITIELSSLFERLKDKDEEFIKNITYKIEDFISDIKKETRD